MCNGLFFDPTTLLSQPFFACPSVCQAHVYMLKELKETQLWPRNRLSPEETLLEKLSFSDSLPQLQETRFVSINKNQVTAENRL